MVINVMVWVRYFRVLDVNVEWVNFVFLVFCFIFVMCVLFRVGEL